MADDYPEFDDFDRPITSEEARPRRRRVGRWIALAVVALVAGGFSAFAYLAYQDRNAAPGGPAPVITAEIGPEKVRPEDPGGMDIPHQDKQVFNRMNPDAPAPKAEHLLPPPEQPVERPKDDSVAADTALPPVSTAPEKVETLIGTPPPAASKPAPPPQTASRSEIPLPPIKAPDKSKSAPVSAAVPPPADAAKSGKPTRLVPQASDHKAAEKAKAVAAKKSPATESETAAAKKAAAVEPAAGGNYKVQLASMRSEPQARASWARLQKAHPAQLGKLSLHIQKVTLKNKKGTYYRVQAGPLADAAAAGKLCATLKARKQGCLVVRP